MCSPETTKVVPSILYTEGQQKIKQQVEEEMKIPDPDEEEAIAAIEAAVKKE